MKIIEVENVITEELGEAIQEVYYEAFGEEASLEFIDRVNEKPALLVTLAYVNEELAGFKIGYARYRHVFFSWLGGVLPQYQRCGIARALMQRQHLTCSTQGYSEIHTEALNFNTPMLLLNIQEGFQVYGCQMGRKNVLSVMLRKIL